MKFQCYYVNAKGIRCKNKQEDYWCSDEHRILWQNSNYPQKREILWKKEVTTTNLRNKLKEIERTAFIVNNTKKNGQMPLLPIPKRRNTHTDQLDLFDH